MSYQPTGIFYKPGIWTQADIEEILSTAKAEIKSGRGSNLQKWSSQGKPEGVGPWVFVF